jgi:spore maturation protein CgeB
MARGHEVQVFEPADAWSKLNLVRDHGLAPLEDFHRVYPRLTSRIYDPESLDLEQVVEDSDVVVVHEWNEPWLVNALGALRNRRAQGGSGRDFTLLFHDTHHRAVSDPSWLHSFGLEHYDGVLAFGEGLTDIYRKHGWNQNVWTWHEAADTRVFYPHEPNSRLPSGDLVWVGNWGDGERAAELETFVFGPARELQLHNSYVYGVRYPREVLSLLDHSGVHYGGWIANFRAPEVYANFQFTVHVPRRYYVDRLPGIPTIRPFEAMACGIPLISSPWEDSEGLFRAGADYLVADNPTVMRHHMRTLLNDNGLVKEMTDKALARIRRYHTCGHRVAQLLDIVAQLKQLPQIPSTAKASEAAA